MFKKLLNKLISVGIVASIILSGLVVFALPVLADSYNAYPDTGQYVYEKSVGGTKLAAGNLLQIIYAKG